MHGRWGYLSGLSVHGGFADSGVSADYDRPMDLTPKRIEEVEFRGSIRGYDRNEVDDFLDRVAAGFGRLQNQLTEAVERATRAEERMGQLEAQLRAQPEKV